MFYERNIHIAISSLNQPEILSTSRHDTVKFFSNPVFLKISNQFFVKKLLNLDFLKIAIFRGKNEKLVLNILIIMKLQYLGGKMKNANFDKTKNHSKSKKVELIKTL